MGNLVFSHIRLSVTVSAGPAVGVTKRLSVPLRVGGSIRNHLVMMGERRKARIIRSKEQERIKAQVLRVRRGAQQRVDLSPPRVLVLRQSRRLPRFFRA